MPEVPTQAVQRPAPHVAERRRSLIMLAVIVVAFLAYGIGYAFAHPEAFTMPKGDGINYEVMVKQLLKTGVYAYRDKVPNAAITPGYPVFLAGVYAASGKTTRPTGDNGGPYRLIYWLQLAFAAGSIVLTYLIGAELFGRTPGLIAAVLLALFPPMQQSALKLLTEPLGMVLFLGYVYVQIVAMRRDRWWQWLIAGLLFGAAVMVRPSFATVGIVPLLYVLVTRRDWRRWLVQAVLLAAGFALVVSPWVVRNVQVMHRPIVLADHTGDPLLAGIDPYHYELGWKYRYSGPTYQDYMKHHPMASGPYAPAYDMTNDEYAMKALGKMFQENPAGTIEWFTIGKLRSMFTRLWEGGTGPMATVTWATLIVMVSFGFMGIVLAFKEERFRLLALMVAIGVATLLPFVPEPRFVFGLMPLLAVLGAGVIYRAWTLRPYGPSIAAELPSP
jgi:4-amino-4-deoxy-L-arabinose transferase-like glycosyltransferase